MDAAGTVLKTVRLELPEKLHYVLRVEAAKHEMSMASYARKLVEEGQRSAANQEAGRGRVVGKRRYLEHAPKENGRGQPTASHQKEPSYVESIDCRSGLARSRASTLPLHGATFRLVDAAVAGKSPGKGHYLPEDVSGVGGVHWP